MELPNVPALHRFNRLEWVLVLFLPPLVLDDTAATSPLPNTTDVATNRYSLPQLPKLCRKRLSFETSIRASTVLRAKQPALYRLEVSNVLILPLLSLRVRLDPPFSSE